MCRPLKDIVAELEAKYKGAQLSYDLNERRRVIAEFDRDVEYMFSRFEKYKEDVKFVLDHKLEIAIIRRSTLNLILIIQELCKLVLSYRHAIEYYLMDEYNEKNSQLYYRFFNTHNELTDYFTRLKNTIVIDEKTSNKDDVINRFRLYDEPEDTEGSYVLTNIKINREEIEHMNAAELILCIDFQLSIFQNNLWVLHFFSLNRDKELMEMIYNLNYILYARTYWPSKCNNFRAHIVHHRLKGKLDIKRLEQLKDEAIYQFEFNTPTGKIWRDYSEDISQMAIKMKEAFIKDKKNEDEEQWKFFFQNIFELEEYDRWIEELRNPPESDEDKQKREKLLKTNKVFNLEPSKSKYKVDILLLYYFIRDRFITEKMFVYEWYALYYILRKFGVLKNCTTEDFVEQMNDEEWFANVNKKCSANEINTYNTFLTERSPESWDVKCKPEGNRASKNSIDNLIRKYSDLENTIDEIYIKE